jgi:hypothetical protein
MFEQTSRLAEKLAASVSRRGFLGSLGRCAAAAALGVAGLLAGTGTARADKPNCLGKCCGYARVCGGATLRVDNCHECPPSLNGCPLAGCGNNAIQGSEGFCLC